MRRRSAVPLLLMVVLLGAVAVFPAQAPETSNPASDPQPQAKPAQQQVLAPEQLDNLVAPIALYPDPLLSQILVASTYPLEVVEAHQWLQRNQNLRGQELVDAAKQQHWDPSIQALVAVPDALEKLNQDIRWTADLGNAFLAQQAQLMDAVQKMRARAKEKGRLTSTPEHTITTQDEGGKQVIVIQPSNPQVIYVPTYDPYWVWGPPVYGYYPPLYYPSFGFGFGSGFDLGFYFGGGWGWGGLGWGGWGWCPSWFGHNVYINNAFLYHHGYYHGHGYGGGYYRRPVWTHDPTHRQSVPYANAQLAARFGGSWTTPRNTFQPGAGQPGVASYYGNRVQARSAASALNRVSQGLSPQAQRVQNPPREWSSGTAYSNWSGSRAQQPSRLQQGYQAPQQYRSAPERYQGSQRVVPFGNQSRQAFDAPQRYAAPPQVYQAPQGGQRFYGQPQMRYQAPQQYRSIPQMTAPRSSGGASFSRGGFSSFNGGGGASFSRGGFGSFSGGGRSSVSRGGNFSGGGGGHRR
jgi:hypothetical protein